MSDRPPDLIEQIPDPDTVRRWLAEAVRRKELLRSLLRVAVRKANWQAGASAGPQRGERCTRP